MALPNKTVQKAVIRNMFSSSMKNVWKLAIATIYSIMLFSRGAKNAETDTEIRAPIYLCISCHKNITINKLFTFDADVLSHSELLTKNCCTVVLLI